jgi:hypothetical protein
MKRERALQVVLVLVGLFYCFWGYLLFDDLWHSRWLSGHSDVMPMFLSLNTALGVCLLVAVNQPAKHRLMIAYGAWSSLAHGFTMTIMSAQAVAHGMHRKDSPQDIVIFGVIGVTLLALFPAKQASLARSSGADRPPSRSWDHLFLGPLARLQQDSPKGGQCEKRTPDTDRPGDRGAVQSGPNLFSIYGPVAFQLALGGKERDRTDVSELFCSCRGLSTHGRKETI